MALIEENICIYFSQTVHNIISLKIKISIFKSFQFGQLSREHFSSLIFNTISENLTIFLGKA